MTCKKCGTQVNGSEKYCPVCGATFDIPVDAPVDTTIDTTPECSVKPPFGLALASLILSDIVALAGLILAIVARAKLNNYINEGGQLVGKGKAANILSKLGLIFSIISLVFGAITFLSFLTNVSYYSIIVEEIVNSLMEMFG